MVGIIGFEPMTSPLSGACSNQLSYIPMWWFCPELNWGTWIFSPLLYQLSYRTKIKDIEIIFNLASPKGFEPLTVRLEISCSSVELWGYLESRIGFAPMIQRLQLCSLTTWISTHGHKEGTRTLIIWRMRPSWSLFQSTLC